jgi:tetratricopeptide (TPR) repeat protein
MVQPLAFASAIPEVSPESAVRGRDVNLPTRNGPRGSQLLAKSRAVAVMIGLVLGGTLTQGCADHASHTLHARTALDAGNSQEALKLLDKELEVDRAEDVPPKLESEKVLLLLDRAMVLSQMERYKLASRDLEVADKQLEILDFKRGTQDEIGKFLFSDQSGPYRAPAYEKLLVNTINMQCYLARGDLAGARVEARRLSVLERFFHDTNDPGQKLMGPGDYLAGFIFEKSGNNDEALRYYDSALALGDYESLADPVRRLMPQSSYQSARLQKLIAANPPSKESEDPSKFAEVLVVVNYGRVPPKIAERLPIGLALTYASGAISPFDQARANRLAAQGLVTWVNFPRLGKPKGEYDLGAFAIDGARQELDPALAIDKAAAAAWEDVQGKVVASAIVRTIARIIAGQAVQKAAGDGLTGFLLGLGTQATMTAADTPDTRSWSTLPARMAIGRVRVAPGDARFENLANRLQPACPSACCGSNQMTRLSM